MAPTPGLPGVDPDEDLRGGGVLRKLLRARRWYGADWWFISIGVVVAAAFLVLAAVPGLFAPFHPLEQAGPRLLPPGARAPSNAVVVMAGGEIAGLEDLLEGARVGALAGTASESDIRQGLAAEVGRPPQGLVLQRMAVVGQMRQLLEAGAVVALVVPSSDEETIDGLLADGDKVVAGELPAAYGDARYVLGTDHVGRDVLSRVIWGARIALLIGGVAPVLSLLIGVPLGIMAGYAGGVLDRTLSVVMDSIFALPALIAAITLTAVLGPGYVNLVVALSIVYVPIYYRISRSRVLSVKEELYVEAAQALGATQPRVLRRYVFPNSIQSAGLFLSISIADAILISASLSFLGLGLPPEVVEWGRDLARARGSLQQAWWLVAFPGLALTTLVFAFTLLGDALVEMYNPKLRKR